MKKLGLLAVGVAIVLVGFIAVLYCLPCNHNWHGHRDRCEMRGGKCPGEGGTCNDSGENCSGDHHEGCENGKENCQVKEWTDADGKVHKEVRVTVGDDKDGGCDMRMGNGGGCNMQMGNGGGCNIQGGNHGCCCCCCMMMMNGCHMGDSMKMDSSKMKVKVRGKL